MMALLIAFDKRIADMAAFTRLSPLPPLAHDGLDPFDKAFLAIDRVRFLQRGPQMGLRIWEVPSSKNLP